MVACLKVPCLKTTISPHIYRTSRRRRRHHQLHEVLGLMNYERLGRYSSHCCSVPAMSPQTLDRVTANAAVVSCAEVWVLCAARRVKSGFTRSASRSRRFRTVDSRRAAASGNAVPVGSLKSVMITSWINQTLAPIMSLRNAHLIPADRRRDPHLFSRDVPAIETSGLQIFARSDTSSRISMLCLIPIQILCSR